MPMETQRGKYAPKVEHAFPNATAALWYTYI